MYEASRAASLSSLGIGFVGRRDSAWSSPVRARPAWMMCQWSSSQEEGGEWCLRGAFQVRVAVVQDNLAVRARVAVGKASELGAKQGQPCGSPAR